MRKKLLFPLVLAYLTFAFSTTGANAMCAVSDIKATNILGLAKDLISSNDLASTNTTIRADAEKKRESQTGNAGCSNGPTNKNTEIKSNSFEFVKKHIKMFTTSEFLPSKPSFKEARDTVIETFFITDETEKGTVIQTQKNKKVKDYTAEVAEKAIFVHNNLLPIVTQDAQSINNASGKGCNQLQAHAMQNRNILSLEKTIAAQIGIQLLQMEAQIAKNLATEDTELLSKPEN